MIAKILGGTINFVVYVSAATMIATVIMVCHLWSTWQMDRGRFVQMLAIAQGLDLFQVEEDVDPLERGPSAEQPSMEQLLQERLSQDRDLKMREMALAGATEQLRMEQRQLMEQRDAYDRITAAFQTEIVQLKQGAEADGRTLVKTTLESVEPDQAKTFILEMLDKTEIEDVVILMSEMDERKRAAVIGEFQTADEITKIAEVLRLIRQGHPEAALAEEVSQKLDPKKPPIM